MPADAEGSMAAVERMLKADPGTKKSRRNAPATAPGFGGGGGGSKGVTWKDPEEEGAGSAHGGMPGKRPEPGSQEELAHMQAAWADPEFRNAFYKQYGEQLKAQGIECDGTFPGNVELNAGAVQGKDGQRGLTITPEAGFVIKSKTLETNEKVFINFCKSPKVRSFSREPDPNDPSVERVRIPLSLGPARNDLDKSGEPCIVYDVVFNTEVMDQAQHAKEFKDFLVGLGMGWVMEKGGGGLDVKNFTEVKLRGNYKGKFPAMQVVRAEALIEELDTLDEGGGASSLADVVGSSGFPHPSSLSATRAAAENSNYADSFNNAQGFHKEGKAPSYAQVEDPVLGVETPQFRMYIATTGGQWAYQEGKTYEGEAQALVVKVELPRMGAASESDLDIGPDLLLLEVAGAYELELDLPMTVDDNAADAAWDRQKRVLTLTLPLRSWTDKAYARHRSRVAAEHGGKVAQVEEVMDTDAADETAAGGGGAGGAAMAATADAAPGADANPLPAAARAPSAAATPEIAPAGGGGEGLGGSERGGSQGRKGSAFSFDKGDKKKAAEGEGAGAGEAGSSKESTFATTLKSKMREQEEREAQASAKQGPRPVRGSKEEADMKEKENKGPSVSNRLPFTCERCNWGSKATAIRKCRRCGWCEPGSREEAEAWEQAKEHEKFRASRKRDEIGAVDETGGVEDESSVRAFRFQCRMMYQLDDDTPGWLEAVREKHYGGAKDKSSGTGAAGQGERDITEEVMEGGARSKEEERKRQEQDRVMPLPVKGLPTIEPLD